MNGNSIQKVASVGEEKVSMPRSSDAIPTRVPWRKLVTCVVVVLLGSLVCKYLTRKSSLSLSSSVLDERVSFCRARLAITSGVANAPIDSQ